MKKQETFNEAGTLQADNQNASGNSINDAFQYLKSLPRNFDRPALESYKRNRTSEIIEHEIAEEFTDKFRGTAEPFYIPVSWSMTKGALVNLLGITDYEGFDEVNGIRFYAGVNDDQQLTLIAVSTSAGIGCDDDLTVEDAYPYYDYADPCPSSCSSRGNLKTATPMQTKVKIAE